ncbi:hypothetical protein KR222_003590, partial [Zaprionus bogoriensis]
DGYIYKTSICEGKNDSIFPMFGTCRGYYICNDGKAIVGYCDKYSQFDALALRCRSSDKVQCTYELLADDYNAERGTNIVLSEFEDTEDVVHNDISVAKISVNAKVHKKPNKESNPNSKEAVFTDSSIKNLCLGKKNGVVLSKTGSCTEYYVCKSKLPQLHECPVLQHFSPTRRICMLQSEANCTLDKKVLKPSYATKTVGLCSDKDGLVPHQDNCGKFLLCANTIFLVMDCPKGLHFNTETKRCDYPKIAMCKVHKKSRKKIRKTSIENY